MIAIYGRRFIVTNVPVEPTDPTTPVPSGDRYFLVGDSITAGAGASNPSLAYPPMLESISGRPVRTSATYGRSVQESVQPWNATNSLYNILFNPTQNQSTYDLIPVYDPTIRYLLIRLGVNDIIQQSGSATNVGTFKTTYRTCLNYIMNTLNYPASKIGFIGIGHNFTYPTLIPSYNNAISELSNEIGALGVCDIFNADIAYCTANGVTLQSIYSDDVHPNDIGHNLHAETVKLKYP